MRRGPWILGTILVLGVLLRVPGSFTPLWLDEIWSLVRVHELGSASAVFTEFPHSNNHHLLSLWFLLVGEDQAFVWYRLPSLLAGCGSIWLAWRAGLRGGVTEGWLAAFLTATSYPLVHYASEGRGYAAAAFFGLGAFLATRQFVTDRRTAGAVLLAACSALGLFSQALFLFVLAGCGAWLLLAVAERRDSPREAAAFLARGFALPVLLCLTFYLVHLRDMTLGAGEPTGPFAAAFFAAALAGGASQADPLALLAALGFVGMLALSLTLLANRRPGEALFHLVAIALAPALLLAATRPDTVPTRWFLIGIALAQLPIAHALARGLTRRGFARVAAIAFLSTLVTAHMLQTARFFRDGRGGYPEAVRYLAEHTRGTDITVGSDHDFRNRLTLRYHARSLPEGRELHYVPQPKLADGWPEWMIGHAYGPPADPLRAIDDPKGRRYVLVDQWPASTLSGLQWFLYQRTDGSLEP
ncbi:MAG: hypothetical protein ACR2PQ_06190 [Myxococcota bacterium]